MSKTHYYLDGREITEEDAIDERGLIRDGVTMRSPLYLQDSAGNFLCDAHGRPLPAGGRRSGFVFSDNRPADHADRYAQHAAYQKAELSARWRGGLQEGDFVRLGTRDMQVIGHSETGKVILADTSQLSAETLKKAAYQDYERDLVDAWKTRAVDSTSSEKVADDEPEQTRDGETLKHEAWLASVEALQNAWRR